MKASLEQWGAFKAVVDEGSFAMAAERLNKSQSSVSYMIARLQDHIPSSLFVQKGRKAELTDVGKVLYRQAGNLLQQAQNLEQQAQYLAQGWEPEVTLALDGIVCVKTVFCALQAFSQEHPQTRLRVLETVLSGTEEALLTRQADIVILPHVPPGFLGELYTRVTMLPVAHPSHEIFTHGDEISSNELSRHRQLVIRDSGTKRIQDGGWLGAEQRWTVSHFATSIEAIKAGLGFGFIPKTMIATELTEGTLKPIPLTFSGIREVPLYLVMANQDVSGAAAKSVASHIMGTAK